MNPGPHLEESSARDPVGTVCRIPGQITGNARVNALQRRSLSRSGFRRPFPAGSVDPPRHRIGVPPRYPRSLPREVKRGSRRDCLCNDWSSNAGSSFKNNCQTRKSSWRPGNAWMRPPDHRRSLSVWSPPIRKPPRWSVCRVPLLSTRTDGRRGSWISRVPHAGPIGKLPVEGLAECETGGTYRVAMSKR